MITKKNIIEGLNNGVINLIADPNMEEGTVCKIGEFWFYFGGETAEEMNPDEFKKNIPQEDIVNEIHDTLESFRKDEDEIFKDEYNYYDAILNNQ